MDIYDQILKVKKLLKMSNNNLGDIIDKSGDTIRKAIKRKSIGKFEMMVLSKELYYKALDKGFKEHEDVVLLNKTIKGKISENNKALNKEIKNHMVNEPTSYIKNKNGLNYEELTNGNWKVRVPKIPFHAYASFIEVYEDEYSSFEDFDFTDFTVDHPGKGKYFAFTTKNDSMNGGELNDTPSDSEVLARELQRHHWKDGFNSSDYGWIIVSLQGMMHKDIEGPDEKGYITCKSRNKSPEFPDFKLNLNEVHTIWKVIKRTF